MKIERRCIEMGFMQKVKENQKVLTENGAFGYATTGKALVDLNFGVPKFRTDPDFLKLEEALEEKRRWTI